MEDLKQLKEKLIQAEKENAKLKHSVDELTDFIENASIPLHWVDGNGIILWANQAELTLLGYPKEEYIGFPISNFHADPEVIQDILTRLTRYETLNNYPASLKCKDGSVKHVIISSNVLQKDGRFVHTRCFTKDITSLIKEEERKANLLYELEESEARLKMAIASTGLGTWDYNPVTGTLYWSDECKNIYGLPLDGTVSYEHFLKQIHPEDLLYVETEIARSVHPEGDGNYDLSYRILRFDDSSIRWIRVQGKVTFADNLAVRFIGTVLDITDHKKADERSAKLAAIIESSDDAIISKTLEGIITSWNGSAERTFGYTEEEMIGQPIMKLIPVDRQDEELHILSRLRRGERVEHFETKRLTKSGNILDISLTISPVKDTDGNIIGLSKIARDIAERKQEEQRKNDFVAMVSHELKTPLTSITAYVQLLLAKAKKEGDAFSLSALTRANNQSRKMIAMIHDFLSLAKLEEGKIHMSKEVFDLHRLIEETADDEQFLTPKHKIKLVSCEEVMLLADRNKIGQVLVNLLSNAVKYSPVGGTITISCKKEAGKVSVSVMDEGIGISVADQKKLFERFYRVSNEQIKTISGFGIGLYLVSEILRYHNSRIEVKSQEGVGSTFYFSLDVYTG